MESKIRGWVERNHSRFGFEDYRIDKIKSGESNYNCILESRDEKYVLRVSREVSRENRLKNENQSLRFLEKEDISRVPKPYYFGEDSDFGPFLIETFVGQEDLDADDFNRKRLDSLAETLAKIHSIPLSNFNSFFDKEKEENTTLKQIYRKDFEEWSREPYEEYIESVDEPDERLVKHFERQKALVDSIPEIETKRSFIHGDLGFNVRASGNEVFIVDWEYARAGYPEHDILYFFEHEGLKEEQRTRFIESYRKHRDLGVDFERTREIYAKFLAFNDSIWAANRVEKDPGRSEKHKEILEDRIEKLETL